MRKFYALCLTICVFFISPNRMRAQCPIGYTQSQINWDWLDYLISTGTYSGFVTPAMASTQHFMMGTTRVTIAASTNAFTLAGENATHTGELLGYTGQDVQYTPTLNNDSLVITFDQVVMNARFTLYDLDNLASFRVTARDNFGVALAPAITLQASTILTLGGIPTAPTVGTASVTNLLNNSNQGSATISVVGPVKVIKIQILNRGNDPIFWLSDINGCVTGSFPNDWRNISRPFTGMAPYILTVVDNNFLMVNPLNGRAKPLFTDPGWTNVNGMAYDPVNRVLYYTFSLMPSSATNKTIWKYDVDAETIGTLTADVTASLGIPTYDQGVESGSASFYNGYYYFGVESSNSGRSSGRENTVWRIEFDPFNNPTRATQVYATRSDSSIGGSATLIHDWSDIGVTNNAMMYDFDGASGDPMYYHFNLMTGQRTQFTPAPGNIAWPRQLAIDWAENVYNQGNTSLPGATTGFIVPYNYNGTVNLAQADTIRVNGVGPTGSWGDCSEAFRPLCDFGDAPASYDPDPWSPAVHERDTALRLGPTFDREWLKTSSILADADGSDEDGVAFVPILDPSMGIYTVPVFIYNNTGSTATVRAWLDFNGNGSFDTGEACQALAAIPSSPTMQTRNLFWSSVTTPIPNGSFTYLRIRLTKSVWGMDNTKATGYYEDGETEDYRVLVDDFPLSVDLISFQARVVQEDHVQLEWKTTNEENMTDYVVERSSDNQNWQTLGTMNPTGNGSGGINNYTYDDHGPLRGRSFYRIRMLSGTGDIRFSEVRWVMIGKSLGDIVLSPNPAGDNINISLYASSDATGVITITDISGKVVYKQPAAINKGANTIGIPIARQLPDGMYVVQVSINDETTAEKLVIQHGK